jgi:hypothetical protein
MCGGSVKNAEQPHAGRGLYPGLPVEWGVTPAAPMSQSSIQFSPVCKRPGRIIEKGNDRSPSCGEGPGLSLPGPHSVEKFGKSEQVFTGGPRAGGPVGVRP